MQGRGETTSGTWNWNASRGLMERAAPGTDARRRPQKGARYRDGKAKSDLLAARWIIIEGVIDLKGRWS
jgi:hypothetical protein